MSLGSSQSDSSESLLYSAASSPQSDRWSSSDTSSGEPATIAESLTVDLNCQDVLVERWIKVQICQVVLTLIVCSFCLD